MFFSCFLYLFQVSAITSSSIEDIVHNGDPIPRHIRKFRSSESAYSAASYL